MEKPMLHEVVEYDGDRNGEGAFVGIVTRRYKNHCHILVGYTIVKRGEYGSVYDAVEYGARYELLRYTGQTVTP
jgi:hypothetical protein